jgi:hypothetical protein
VAIDEDMAGLGAVRLWQPDSRSLLAGQLMYNASHVRVGQDEQMVVCAGCGERQMQDPVQYAVQSRPDGERLQI